MWQFSGGSATSHTTMQTVLGRMPSTGQAGQMIHLRRLMESRPFLTHSDQSILLFDEGERGEYRCCYATVKVRTPWSTCPALHPAGVRLDWAAGSLVRAAWYNPRNGGTRVIGEFSTATKSLSRRAVDGRTGCWCWM